MPRSQMKMNSATTTLRKNQSSGHQPLFAPSQIEIGHGARQPPRNSVAASAETVTMLMYSARKNSANFSDEYSVEAADQLALGLGQVERRPVGLTDHRDHVDHERDRQQHREPARPGELPAEEGQLVAVGACAPTISEVDIVPE